MGKKKIKNIQIKTKQVPLKLISRLKWDEKEKKILVLQPMFKDEEIEKYPELMLDIKQEIRDECSKYGEVTKVILKKNGKVLVRFKSELMAKECALSLEGRYFDGELIKISFN